jgi:tetratricopeptide (TPR) repeat protein
VAYDSLLLARRQVLHAAAGQALKALYPERLEELTDRLAYHYGRTTEAATAVAYLTRPAEQAARKCAHAEAVTALQEGLRQIERLPPEAQDQSVADVGLRLVDSLHYLGRFLESLDVLLRQQAQLAQHQDIASVGLYHVQLGFTYSMLGDPERAVESAHRALAAARYRQDPVTMGRAQYVLALTSYWSGQPQRGIAHSQQAIAVLEQTDERESLGMAYFYLGVNCALLGVFAAALDAASQTQALGQAIEDPALQCYVAWLTGWIQAMQGDWAPGIARCQHSLARSPHPLNTVP